MGLFDFKSAKHEYCIEHKAHYRTYNIYNTIFETVLICISLDFILGKLIMFNRVAKLDIIYSFYRFVKNINGSVLLDGK